MFWVVSLFNLTIFSWTTLETLSVAGLINRSQGVLTFNPALSVQLLFLIWILGNIALWLIARKRHNH